MDGSEGAGFASARVIIASERARPMIIDQRTQGLSDRYAHFYDGKNAAKALCDIIEWLESERDRWKSRANGAEVKNDTLADENDKLRALLDFQGEPVEGVLDGVYSQYCGRIQHLFLVCACTLSFSTNRHQ